MTVRGSDTGEHGPRPHQETARSPEPSRHAGALRLPYTLGRYTLFDFIGRGGMAQIYLARTNSDLGASRLCVLKLILPEYAEHPQFADMLTHEAKLAAQLGHANIVHVFELGRIDGRLFIAMEYVEGFDLNALLRRCSRQKVPLPMEFALYVVICVLRGLDYAHRRTDDAGKLLGIVHRDVSPSNVLVSFDGEIKVCDFGIAHANDVMAQAPLADDAIKGKAGYMSPEQARGAILDARADVFAAGIILWELLAGRRLYRHGAEGSSRSALLEQARKAAIPPLPKRSLPREAELHAVVMRALAADKNERYPSAAAMLRDLEAYAIGTGRMPNPIKLGVWLSTHFGNEVIAHRRMRERAAALSKSREARESRNPEPPRESRNPEPPGFKSIAGSGAPPGEVAVRDSLSLQIAAPERISRVSEFPVARSLPAPPAEAPPMPRMIAPTVPDLELPTVPREFPVPSMAIASPPMPAPAPSIEDEPPMPEIEDPLEDERPAMVPVMLPEAAEVLEGPVSSDQAPTKLMTAPPEFFPSPPPFVKEEGIANEGGIASAKVEASEKAPPRSGSRWIFWIAVLIVFALALGAVAWQRGLLSSFE